jgi:radical SAM protein with 4Fe4S-binding SPASM domain
MTGPLASPALTQLVLKPTIFCYHRCSYCDLRQDYYSDLVAERKMTLKLAAAPAGGRRANPGHMPRDMALRMVDQAAELGMRSLQLSGGDPLLYPHLLDVIRAGAKYPDVFVFMNSVGTGVSVEDARTIIAAGLRAWNFSVDTLDAEKYDEIRGIRGAFTKIQAAIETVRTAARDYPDFDINYMAVITRKNFRDLPALIGHCLDTGVASVHLMNVYGDKTGESLLTAAEIGEFRAETVPAILRTLTDRGVPELVQTNAVEVMGTFYSRANSDENYAKGLYWASMAAAKQGCNTPNFYSLIEPDGRVLPCCLVEISHEGEVGNVTDSSLKDVWNGEGYQEFRQKRISFCQECSAPQHKTLGLLPKMCRQFNDGNT